jgi:hypothetical protein
MPVERMAIGLVEYERDEHGRWRITASPRISDLEASPGPLLVAALEEVARLRASEAEMRAQRDSRMEMLADWDARLGRVQDENGKIREAIVRYAAGVDQRDALGDFLTVEPTRDDGHLVQWDGRTWRLDVAALAVALDSAAAARKDSERWQAFVARAEVSVGEDGDPCIYAMLDMGPPRSGRCRPSPCLGRRTAAP